jgi:hypothetical protein
MAARFVSCLVLVALGCSSSGGPGYGLDTDAGRRDAGLQDGGAHDGGSSSGVVSDGGADGGSAAVDAGAPDAGSATTPDAGSSARDGGPTIENCAGVTFVEPCATCMRTNCNAETGACFGPGWQTRDFTDGKCQSHFECVCPCGNNGGCLANCPDPDADCLTCLLSTKQCQLANCLLFCGA